MRNTTNYGTTNNNTHDDEPLLPKSTHRPTVQSYLNHTLTRQKADLILLFTYITTGLLDSTAIAAWGSFVSMQTGNTIYFGLGLSHPTTSSTRWLKAGTSILSFCIGSFLFARFHRHYSARRRWVLLTSTLIQFFLVVVAALIVTLMPSPDKLDDLHWSIMVPIALVAFQSAGQAVISRALEHNSLTSVVLTSIYCDLFSDAKLFAGLTENVERNRRAAAPLLLLLGAVMGGLCSKTELGVVGALWTVAVLKFVVALAWMLWPVEKESDN